MDAPYRGRAAEITAAALKHGVMILVAGADVLRFAPSLLLDDEDMAEGLARLENALVEFAAANRP